AESIEQAPIQEHRDIGGQADLLLELVQLVAVSDLVSNQGGAGGLDVLVDLVHLELRDTGGGALGELFVDLEDALEIGQGAPVDLDPLELLEHSQIANRRVVGSRGIECGAGRPAADAADAGGEDEGHELLAEAGEVADLVEELAFGERQRFQGHGSAAAAEK